MQPRLRATGVRLRNQVTPPIKIRKGSRSIYPVYGSHHCAAEDCVGVKNPWIVLLEEKERASGLETGTISMLRAACSGT